MPTWGPRCSSTAATEHLRTARPRSGLGQQVYALNVARADYDNDGVSRRLAAAWRLGEAGPAVAVAEQGGRCLRGRDSRQRAGRADLRPSRPPGATTTTTGWLDLFVCGEYLRRSPPIPTHTAAGSITIKATARSWTSPPRPVLSTSTWPRGRPGAITTTTAGSISSSRTMDGPCRLYHNEGDGTFRDVARGDGRRRPCPRPVVLAAGSGTTTTTAGSTSSSTTTTASLAERRGRLPGPEEERPQPPPPLPKPRQGGLSRREPGGRSRLGPSRRWGPISATSTTTAISTPTSEPVWMAYSGLVPNVMLKNVEGRRFEDVTDSSRTGHLQKGHGVSFADWDCDGDLDLFVEPGRRLSRRPGLQRPVPEPRPWPALAEGQARRHQDQSLGDRGQDPGRSQSGPAARSVRSIGRSATTAASAGNSLGRDDRPGRRNDGRPVDGELADQQDDPDLPRHRRRPAITITEGAATGSNH